MDGFHNCGPWSKHYFLSHFHADHYGGLGRGFTAGTIYCTEETARLVTLHLGVPRQRLAVLSLGKAHRIDGKQVTLVEGVCYPAPPVLWLEGKWVRISPFSRGGPGK